MRYSKMKWAVVVICFLLLLLLLFLIVYLLRPFGFPYLLFSSYFFPLIVFDFILVLRLSYWIALCDLCCGNVQWNAVWDGKLHDGSWSWGGLDVILMFLFETHVSFHEFRFTLSFNWCWYFFISFLALAIFHLSLTIFCPSTFGPLC